MQKILLFFSAMLCGVLAMAQGSVAYDNCPSNGATPGNLEIPSTINPDGSGFQLNIPADATYDSYVFMFENPNDILPQSTFGPGGPRILDINTTGLFDPSAHGLGVGDQVCVVGFSYNLADLQSFIDSFTPGSACCSTLTFVGIDCSTFPDGSSVTDIGSVFSTFGLTDIAVADLNGALNLLGSLGCPAAPCYASSAAQCMTIEAAAVPCTSYAGGPYSDQDIDVAPCEAGASISAPYAAWYNEVYYTEVQAGGNYTFSICDGYDATAWGGEAFITAILNGTPNAGVIEGGTVLGTAVGCEITFTATEAGTVFFTLTTEDGCGTDIAQIDNGVPTITTNSGTSCGVCGDGECTSDEGYPNCPDDCPCSTDPVYVDFDDAGQAFVSEAAALYCEGSFTGVEAAALLVPLATFGDAVSAYTLGNEDAMTFVDLDADGNIITVTEVSAANIAFLYVTQEALDASGGSTTVTFTADDGACSGSLTIDWTAFGEIDIAAACTTAPTCEASYGTVLFEGATSICEGGELAPICLDGDNTSAEYGSVIVLTIPPSLQIVGLGAACEATSLEGLPAGDYIAHPFNILLADTTTLVDALMAGATGVDVADMIAAGQLCAALDVAGVPFTILAANDPACNPNTAPTAADIEVTSNPNSNIFIIDLSMYASDAEGGVLTYMVEQPAMGGSVEYDAATGLVTITIADGYSGNIEINYSVSDGEFTTTATLTLSVEATVDVSLIRLSGTPLNNGNLIEWATATEINNDYFTIHRSTDGVNYSAIATVKGNGNSNTIRSYSHLDKTAATMTYYRLSQTDFDGSVQVVGNVVVRRNSMGLNIVSLEPNPVKDIAQLSFTAIDNSAIQLSIHDATGKVVDSQSLTAVAGNNNFTLQMSNFASGLYFVTLSNNANTVTTKLIKQ
jgi:hypothetical protein